MNSPRNRVGPWVAPRRDGPPLVEELNGIEVAIERQKKLATEFRSTARIVSSVLAGFAFAAFTFVTGLYFVVHAVAFVASAFGADLQFGLAQIVVIPLSFCVLVAEVMVWKRLLPWAMGETR
jgi:hypothetical protein